MGDLVGAGADETRRRAMQRRLRKLVAQGRVQASGEGKARRYHGVGRAGGVAVRRDDASLSAQASLFIPLSGGGADLQRRIRSPVEARTPVSYNRAFLNSYRPGVTSYLTQAERSRLADLGRTGEGHEQPAGTYARRILDRLLIDLSWNSSRLEGNTYSILDTHLLIERGREAEGHSAQEAQMILNHKEAIEYLVESVNDIGFNRHTILNLHALLSNNLLPDPQASGRLRRRLIGIGGSPYTPLQAPDAIEECFAELLSKADAIPDPFEQAFFVLVQLPYLQPFEDVNKRVSRLAANIPFIRRNLSPLSFVDVPERDYVDAMLSVYEFNEVDLARDMFVWACERSAQRYAAIRQSLGQPDAFRLRYREELRAVVAEVIRERLAKGVASQRIAEFASHAIGELDRRRFVETAETELLGLHEGNYARYRVRPSEFFGWKAVWESD